MIDRSLSSALSSVLRRIPRSRTLVPAARIRSATGPGLYSVTTSLSCLVYFRISASWISAPPTSRPVMTCRTFTRVSLWLRCMRGT